MSLLSRHLEFYEFARGPQVWRHVAENRPLVYQQQTYTYANIKRSALSESVDLTRNTLDLTVTLDLPLLDLYRGRAPMEDIAVTLYRMRKSDSTVARAWAGVVGSVEFKASTAVIHCLPPMASLKALGLKLVWSRNCPYVVYSAGLGQCNADRAAMRINATLSSVTGAQVQADAFAAKPDGWLSGGWIEWQVGTATERRFVTDHVGTTLTLLTPALVQAGTTVAAYPGCDGTLATCDSKFGNSANFGGNPWLPLKNPFGDSVY